MSRPRIVVIGSSNTDLVVRARRIPAPGETVLGGSYMTAAGGKGANQAVAAARLGAEVAFVGRVGRDTFGDAALAALREEGINTELVARDESAPSGVALIVVDEQGENAIAVAPGANDHLGEADVDRARVRIAAADAVLLQLETPIATVAHAAQVAHELGVRVMLNPAPAEPLGGDLLAHVTVLTPNEGEARLLSGMRVDDADSAERAARALCGRGVANVVVTMGAEGAVFMSESGVGRVAGASVRAVDTTAAGDAFTGALSYALAAGRPLSDAVRFASTAGALAVTRAGAQPSLPTRDEVEAFSPPGEPER
jgi:ribokinase